ncbi:hypothetical protein N7510_005169 [Penicillium lagena]|uniref:uncharacterized protein n=1 Tax=Penicillium lagena TaxID=94218 RepID=UPI0025417DB8|nr:uncharacterized protein N7510_005169 [Penicillium lagena]KAJ5611975.1 hypothetical protein N7510_005169 [Penicillium lagena]
MDGHSRSVSPALPVVVFIEIMHCLLPAIILVSTSKRSVLRYFSVLAMTFMTMQATRPVLGLGHTGAYFIGHIAITTLQAADILLINPKDSYDLGYESSSGPTYCLIRAIQLVTQTRAINTPWQVKNVPSFPKYYTRRNPKAISRPRFLSRQLSIATWQYLILDIFSTLTIENAPNRKQDISAQIEWNLSFSQWIERAVSNLIAWFFVARLLIDIHYRIFSIIFVAFGIDKPSSFPPLFARVSMAYTLRKFWGNFWHQMLRKPFTAVSNFVARNLLCLPRPSILERYINIFIVFLLSGMMHVFVDVSKGIAPQDSGAIAFFTSFTIGFIIEDGIQILWKRLWTSKDNNYPRGKVYLSTWQKTVGFCWVMLWLSIVSTWYFEPMRQSTVDQNGLVPFRISSRFGLHAVLPAVIVGAVILHIVFETEV